MPFNYSEYTAECKTYDDFSLRKEWERYTRMSMSSSAGTGISLALGPFTFGVSLIGTAAGGASMRNALKKLAIIERELNSRGISPTIRKRDLIGGYGLGCTVGAVTHGAGGHLVDSAVHHAVNHATHHAVNHATQHAVNHAASASDHAVMSHEKLLKAAEKGTDKLAEKGSKALEEHAYGEAVVARKLSEPEKYADGK